MEYCVTWRRASRHGELFGLSARACIFGDFWSVRRPRHCKISRAGGTCKERRQGEQHARATTPFVYQQAGGGLVAAALDR